MSWNLSKLGDNCTITSSRRFHLDERKKEGVPFYSSKEVIQLCNGESITDCQYISDEAYEDVKCRFGVPKENDLLLTTRGTYGIPYLYRSSDKFYFSDGNLTWFKDFGESLDSKFLYYWFKSSEGWGKVDSIAKGTAQKAVPIDALKDLEIPLPPLPIQRRIADILSAYDDLIENNQRQIKLLEEAAMRLYREWFVFMRFPGHESVRIEDGVPEGWERVTVESVLDKIPTTIEIPTSEMLTDGKIPVIDQSNAYIAGYTNNEEAKIVYDVPIIIFGDHTRILKLANFPFAQGADGTKLIISKNPSMPQHLLYYSLINLNLSSHHYARHFKYLKESLVIQPTLEIALMFEKIASLHHEEITKLRVMNRSLTLIRDALLPRLMNGGEGLKLEGGAV